jgi:hypothetical protein
MAAKSEKRKRFVKSGLGTQLAHVVGAYRMAQSLEEEFANRFELCQCFEG